MVYNNTLESASLAGRSDIFAGIAGIACRETADVYETIGRVYPCGESFKDLQIIQTKAVPVRMQTNESGGR